MYGKVLYGINNIYAVRTEEEIDYLCRIKGKVLKGCENRYNPIAAGDNVEFEPDASGAKEGKITALVPRKNAFTRWNRKRFMTQIIASNIDLLLCTCASAKPPFRPRFIDKITANSYCKYKDDFEIALVLNKIDLGTDKEVLSRLRNYEEIGFKVFKVSAKKGDGIDELRDYIKGKYAAFAGQSGVGKSSLLNVLDRKVARRVGEVSRKYNRGKHVTSYSLFVPDKENGGGITDTPGIREIFVDNIEPEELIFHFREFVPYFGKCGFSTCTHTVEKGCRIIEAVKEGSIHRGRYDSYVRIYDELTAQASEIYGKRYT